VSAVDDDHGPVWREAAAVRTSLRGLAADTAVTVATTAAASAMMATKTFVT